MSGFWNLLIVSGVGVAQATAQGLELGNEDPTKVISNATQFPYSTWVAVTFIAYLVLAVLFIAFLFVKNNLEWRPPILLERLPVSAKAAITLALISYALVHALSLVEVYLVTNVSFHSASEYFYYMKLSKLAATSHAHFFGHATMYLITSLVFVFSRVRERWKLIFIVLAMSAGLLDVPSWWAIKYGGPQYELFSAIAGVMSVVGWGTMAVIILFELWKNQVAEVRK